MRYNFNHTFMKFVVKIIIIQMWEWQNNNRMNK